MQNEEVAKVLDQIAEMLEVAGENFFRVRAYRTAARTVRDLPVAAAELSTEKLDEIPGIGSDLAEKIATIVKTGDLPIRRELAAKFPADLLELTHVPGLGPKRVKLLVDELKIRNRADLLRAAKAGALRTVRGFGSKIEERILEALGRREASENPRMRYADAARIAENLVAHLRKCRTLEELEVAGSFRRRRETVGDLDLLATALDADSVMKQFAGFPGVGEVVASGETKTTLLLKESLQVDLRVVPPSSFGAALVYFTGSKAHNVHLRRIAQTRGLLLNEYGLFRNERVIVGKTEEDVYRALGLIWIPPELREDRGEIEAAASGKLPKLVEREDLRGDLHVHTNYTDGRASLEEMAWGARDNGLDYVAITDHSRRVAMARGLDSERLHEQRREVDRLRARLSGLELLHGIEVDILEDGSLDLPDQALAELDWVIASVHYKLEQGSVEMTRRLIKAMRNPNVDVIGHPSGRLLNQREPSRFDLAEVLRVAREEGCALEVNSQPDRLDLTDSACLAAKRAGVRLVISSDAHSPHDFELIKFGINQARRGWIEADDVLNTRPVRELRVRR